MKLVNKMENGGGYQPDKDFLNRGGEQFAAESGQMSEAQRRSNEVLQAQIRARDAQIKKDSEQQTQPIKPIVPGSAASRWAKR